MNKPLLGLMLGGILGIFDGLTALFPPAVRSQMMQIVLGSAVKGLIAGILIGYFAKKVNSLALGIVFGLGVGLLLALGLGRVLAQMLYQVSPSDPVALIASSIMLGSAALLACFLPARRAMRVTPMTALRTE